MSNPSTEPGDFTWQEDRYREVLRTPNKCDLLVKIWRDAFADEYPEDADPFGFVTVSDLNRFLGALKLEPGAKLLDVGCGRGGPGLWIARKTGASLIGIDILPEAIAQARLRQDELALSQSVEFFVGTFGETKLPAASVQAIMSVDSFWMVLDKPGALAELARVIVTGGRLAMTTWVLPYMETGAMMNAAGFQLLSSEEPAGWRERQVAVYRAILRNRKELALAIGERAAEVLISEAEQAPARLLSAPRCFLVAERMS